MNYARAEFRPPAATLDLRGLRDLCEIAELIDRLGLWLDEKRFDEARSILNEDVTVEASGGSASGIEATVEQARRNHPDGTGSQHLISNCIVDPTASQLTAGTLGVPFPACHPSYR